MNGWQLVCGRTPDQDAEAPTYCVLVRGGPNLLRTVAEAPTYCDLPTRPQPTRLADEAPTYAAAVQG